MIATTVTVDDPLRGRRRPRRPDHPRPARGQERPDASRCATTSSPPCDRPGPTTRCGPLLITGAGRLVLRRHGPAGVDGGQRRRAGVRPPRHERGAASRRADVHPGAVGARQADRRRGQRHRGRPGRPPGPGLRLRAACTPTTRFVWSFARWGLVVDAGGAYLLPRLVGLPRAKAMVMLGEGASGQEAVDLGLAYSCVDSTERAGRGVRGAGRPAGPRARPARSGCPSSC